MPARIRDSGRFASAWALSVAAHGALLACGALLVAGSLSSARAPLSASGISAPPPAIEPTIELDLPTLLDDGSLDPPPSTKPQRAPRGGGEAPPRPDTGVAGRAGRDTVDLPAINLADRDDAALISSEVRSRIDRSQVQRIESAKERASREDWRASREPMELTFVASGLRGSRPERRLQASNDPSAGVRDRGAPSRRGGVLGSRELSSGAGFSPRAVGGSIEGGAQVASGLGVRDGSPGEDHRASAEVALARPMVAQGTPSIPANAQGRPNDTVDSEQEVATPDQSIVHASTAGGDAGPGTGGQESPRNDVTGSGGVSGGGSVARPLGTGPGAGVDNDRVDPRRLLYMRNVMAKLYPLWANAFPKSAALEGRQGLTIITFVIAADGRVTSASVTRPSGIPEFDENCRKAVLRGSPYEPLPSVLGKSFRWAMPFEVKNPVVRPRY